MLGVVCRSGGTVVRGNRMYYEPNENPHFLKMIKEGDVFFDVGAMIGYYCLLAAGHGAKRVIAIEIIKEFADFTKKTFKKNNIDGMVLNYAVGKTGQIIYENELTKNTSPTTSLDDLCELYGFPDVVKMDIEGHEFNALNTAKKLLANHPRLDISIHPAFLKEHNQTKQGVVELLKSHGYKEVAQYSDTHFYK